MIKSMTGFGKCAMELPDRSISVEIKSLNSKQFDANLRLPHIYRQKEGEIRTLLSTGLERGKVELNINLDQKGDINSFKINHDLAKQYYKEIKAISEELGIELNDHIVNTIIKMPEVMKVEQQELSEEEWLGIRQAVLSAIESLNEFRSQEGAALEKDLIVRVGIIEKLLLEVAPLESIRIERLRARLLKQLEESFPAGTNDMNRFEQEVIYYLEKLDITEEKVRLKKHCEYFIESLAEEDSNGKKLGFISQEMGREINTLGSKANNADIQKIVVLMKDELEKIKEQLFNIL